MRLPRCLLPVALLALSPVAAFAAAEPAAQAAPKQTQAKQAQASQVEARSDRGDAARAEPDANASKAGDARIRQQLDALGYKYQVDEDGDFVLTFGLDGKRSQMAYVLSSTQSYGNLQVREVWSPGYRGADQDFPADVANRLLEDSHLSKMGGWVKQDGVAVFVVKLDAGAAQDDLDDAIDYVVRAADQMEALLTPGKDEF
ncbi:YbjN domain-containing protein [Lysobacter capsici]|uniref:YbjN domain-containing protein n=1 Tax=Lysobacter capsici TaxID=435897 RepID=UPI001BFFE61C|nr:YbjN domain-containing protein [Lysobacter capsici]QWF19415.1 YbjN domain-containing protein [Lysobacter capsici]